WLGRQLQPYEIASKTMRIGKALAKGYVAADFREALQRYFTRAQSVQKSEVREQKSEAEQENKSEDGAAQNSEVSNQSSRAKGPGATDQKPEVGDPGLEAGGASEDDAAAA